MYYILMKRCVVKKLPHGFGCIYIYELDDIDIFHSQVREIYRYHLVHKYI